MCAYMDTLADNIFRLLRATVSLLIVLIPALVLAGTDVTLAWNANDEPDLAGYRIHWGDQSGNYTSQVDVGNVTEYKIENLPDGTYFFAATAYDDSGNESGYSNEVSATLTDDKAPGIPEALIILLLE